MVQAIAPPAGERAQTAPSREQGRSHCDDEAEDDSRFETRNPLQGGRIGCLNLGENDRGRLLLENQAPHLQTGLRETEQGQDRQQQRRRIEVGKGFGIPDPEAKPEVQSDGHVQPDDQQ